MAIPGSFATPVIEIRCGTIQRNSGNRCKRALGGAYVDATGSVKYPPTLAINPHPNVPEPRGLATNAAAVTDEKFQAQEYDRRDFRCRRGHGPFTVKNATIARELLEVSARGGSTLWLADVV